MNYPYLAYLKPTKLCPPNHPRAANEKIAFDLAYYLGLPVPPVLLYRRKVENKQGNQEETRTCISFVIYSKWWKWFDIWDSLPDFSESVRNKIKDDLTKCSGMIAFDVFLGQTDRNNSGNVIYGWDPNNTKYSGFGFIDFSYSMNYNDQWDNAKWTNLSKVSIPQFFDDYLDINLIHKIAEDIANLPDSVIKSIVSRIDEDYLQKPERIKLIGYLIGRKKLIDKFIQSNYTK